MRCHHGTTPLHCQPADRVISFSRRSLRAWYCQAKFNQDEICARAHSWAGKTDHHNIERYDRKTDYTKWVLRNWRVGSHTFPRKQCVHCVHSAMLSNWYSTQCPANLEEWYDSAGNHAIDSFSGPEADKSQPTIAIIRIRLTYYCTDRLLPNDLDFKGFPTIWLSIPQKFEMSLLGDSPSKGVPAGRANQALGNLIWV